MIPWRIRMLLRALTPEGAGGWLAHHRWTREELGLDRLQAEDVENILADMLSEPPESGQLDRQEGARGTVVVMDADADLVAWLAAVAPRLHLVPALTEAEALPHLSDAIALLGWSTPTMLRSARRLRWFQAYTSGLEALRQVADELPDHLRVTSMRGVAAPAIAEHALGLLLSLTRRLDLADRPHTRWRRRRAIEAGGTRPMTLAGSRALVVGLGSVGRHIASLTTALGMETWGIRRRAVPGEPGVRGSFSLDELADRIHGFSVVFNALPLTARTAGVFDRAMFDRMPSGSFFINVGRGATVKTADLVAVLGRGPLAGAGLDVTDPEPLPWWHPLLRAPNALITQHRAGVSAYTRRRELVLLRENLRRFQAGEPLLCQADPRAGY